jgi:hypothetical protein
VVGDDEAFPFTNVYFSRAGWEDREGWGSFSSSWGKLRCDSRARV